MDDAEVLAAQIKTIEQQRQLLEEPDPIAPLVANLAQLLRHELNKLDHEYESRHVQGLARLQADANWQQIDPEQRHQLLSSQLLHEAARPKVDVQSTAAVLATLDTCSLSMFADRVAAMPARFDNVAAEAAERYEPQVQFIQVPRRTLKTKTEIDVWIEEVRRQLESAVQAGPVVIR